MAVVAAAVVQVALLGSMRRGSAQSGLQRATVGLAKTVLGYRM